MRIKNNLNPLNPLVLFLSIPLFCSSLYANELNTESFSTLDDNSGSVVKEFLQLPSKKAIPLALKTLKEAEKTDDVWEVFLIHYLSLQKLDKKSIKSFGQTRIYQTIENYNSMSDFLDTLDQKEFKNASPLCQKIIVNEESGEGLFQSFALLNTQKVCLALIGENYYRAEFFGKLVDHINDPSSRLSDDVIEQFSPTSLAERIIFSKKDSSSSLDELSSQQRTKLIRALVMAFMGNKSDEDSFQLGVRDVGRFFNKMDKEDYQLPFLKHLKEYTSALDRKQWKRILKGLLYVDSEESAKLFWELALNHQEKDLSSVFALLEDQFNDGEYSDEAFPQRLHETAIDIIKDKKDIKFATTYLYFIVNAEGGDGWDHGIETGSAIASIEDELEKNKETMGMLKYCHYQLAAIEYFQDTDKLVDVKDHLDIASAISAPLLSWYAKQTQTDDEVRLDQDPGFIGIKTLYEGNLLSAVIKSVKYGKKPDKPFLDLPAIAYSPFIKNGNNVVDVIWDNKKTGEAWLRDDSYDLFFFNGYKIDTENATIPLYSLAFEEDLDSDNGEMPSLTAPVSIWIEYAINKLTDTPQKADTKSISEFVNASKAKKEMNDRILLAHLSEGSVPNYPDYTELVRYGSNVLINIKMDDSTAQYWLKHKNDKAASDWFQNIRTDTPKDLQEVPLWYKKNSGVMMRSYSNNEETITLSTHINNPSFVYEAEGGCNKAINIDSLNDRSVAFAKAELELYKKGYLLDTIGWDDDCVSVEDVKAAEEE